jgi:hypothetical protein
MHTSTTLFAAFATVAMAMPTSNNVQARAGGPIAKPIPSSCTVTYPIPTLDPSQGYIPAPSTNDALFYGAYYPSPSTDKTALAEQCLQQCYGYGDSTECKTAYWAENVEVPKGYYGSPGGTYNTACLFYNRTLTKADLVKAPEGKGTTPFVADLAC